MYQMFPHLREHENTAAGVPSSGEQRMLTLCRMLMSDPDFVAIDESTEDLAPLIVTLVGGYLKTLKEWGISVLLVEQKLAIVLDASQRVYVMGRRQIVSEGTSQQLKAGAKVRQEWLEM